MNIDGALVSRFPGRLRTLTLLGAVVAALALSGGFTPANAQSRDLTGVVRDSLNSESLPNAFVYLVGQPFRTLTDEFGRFTLVDVPEGVHTLRVEYLGYLMGEVEVAVATAGALTVYLAPAVIELEGITVESSGQIAQVAEEISQITLSPRRLNTLPSLGETDIFRALQLLPGVSGTTDATSGLFIRGGTSSVVEMIGKSGDPENFNMSAGMNLLSGRAVTEVPLGGKGSWLLSARRSYTDVIRTGLYNDIFNTLAGSVEEDPVPAGPGGGFGGRGGRGGNFQQQTIQPDFFFYDLNSKLTYTPTGNDVVALSVYAGEDKLDESSLGQQITGPDGQTRLAPDRVDVSDWGNLGASGRWSRQWGSRFTTDALAAYSEYFSEGSLDVSATQFARGFREDNRVTDFTVRLDNSWRPFQASDVGFGVQMTRSEVRYSFSQLQGDSVRGALDLGGEGTLGKV